MVAYFKLQNNLLMAVGALIGLAAGAAGFHSFISPAFGWAGLFVGALLAFAGVVIGRIFSSWYAGRRLGKLLSLLYKEDNPQTFLEKFEPVAARTPSQTVEYINGVHHLAYAWEAMGNYEKALELLEPLEPEKLRLHALVAQATVTNHKLRLHLLMKDTAQAASCLNDLTVLWELAIRRAPAVGQNLKECLRLSGIWLKALAQTAPLSKEDFDYIREEISLANNPIHKREIEALLKLMEQTAPV